MARITARQAFTRAKSRQDKRKSELARTLLQARDRYINQLVTAGISYRDENPFRNLSKRTLTHPEDSGRPLQMAKRKAATANNKKITDYFPVTTEGRENVFKNSHTKRQSTSSRLNISSSFDLNGTEIITIGDSGSESFDDNNNHSNHHQLPQHDVKPCQPLNVNNLNTSFQELNFSLQVDDDIEIVEMLPPIPLRDHPVFDLDET